MARGTQITVGAVVKNPRKQFLWSINFAKHPVTPMLFQSVTLPEVSVEQVEHSDLNFQVKTGGRVTIGNLTATKLESTSGSDTLLWDWMNSVQSMVLKGGLLPTDYKDICTVNELAEDGVSVLNTWICTGVWPCRINGQEMSRGSSDNTIEQVDFSVDLIEKL